MICQMCREAAAVNRYWFDTDCKIRQEHPGNCNCGCMHKMPTQWEDMYSVPQPGKAKHE